MQTSFQSDQRHPVGLTEADEILRKCVHCGFCTATCPTYVISGDELDGPRGRIYLIKEYLEHPDVRPSVQVMNHLDRCTGCRSCMTTCPSGVDFARLLDVTRADLEIHHRRPFGEHLFRSFISWMLTDAVRLQKMMALGRLFQGLPTLFPAKIATLLRHLPHGVPRRLAGLQDQKAHGTAKRRILLHLGCVSQVVRPEILNACQRLLERWGCEVVIASSPCCGALDLHLSKEQRAIALARQNILQFEALCQDKPIDGIVTTASGCGVMFKDYPALFRHDAHTGEGWQDRAQAFSQRFVDVFQLLDDLGYHGSAPAKLRVALHLPCSQQHGLKQITQPKALLQQAGFSVVEPVESHLCCGSAGSYSLLQPDMAHDLGNRKARHLEALESDVIASANIGCLEQIARHLHHPVVHGLELLDWADGGPNPLHSATANAISKE